jgi:uncharacterized protein YjbJ (UPF0337 family)
MSNPISEIEPEETPPRIAVVAPAAAEPEPECERSAAERLNQTLTQAFDGVVQSGPSDQLRGYANEAVGRTKLAVGLALRSPELALAGLAQGALGAVQRYVGEAKMAAETEGSGQVPPEEQERAAP